MSWLTKNALKLVFAIDAVIAIGFGLYSWLNPIQTFGTIILIPEDHSSEILSILSSLSLFYILIGFTCLIGIKSKYPTNFMIAFVMTIRHLFEGIIKYGDLSKQWLIGNPYPDLIIHFVFVLLYLITILFTFRKVHKN